jgi:tetratricopeptide (TPR) repeat protein
LAKIRHGDLKEGREEIEIAASLDPDNSLIRSYLGKAYYEEKRDKLAQNQFAMAKELDPKDPTAWFYDAIRKQSVNRPVEALEDLQKSIELNDNRAVYRSRLMLDEDLAARSASLGSIYNDLGFQQLALVEGWNSVNADPANYSAHRFLADSYAALPRHEIARVSELLQSQLLQPINITPVQPSLAEGNLFILEGAGPSDPSFNEFNPLFERNRLALQASGVAGGNSILGNELVQSGVWGRYSYSIGQFHYETDGFRENNDQNRDIYNVFTQASLTPKTSLQGEFRSTDIDKGDMLLTFLDLTNPYMRQKDKINTLRFGVHHAFTPRSDILSSFIYQHAHPDVVVIPDFFELSGSKDNYVGEVRYLFRPTGFNFTAGIGHRHMDETFKANWIPSKEELDTDFTNVYAYSHIDFPKNVSLTVGGSADFFNGVNEDEDRDQFNPKFGIMWNPVRSTILRGAIFRTLTRPFMSPESIDPTLEPTQVAGFNQFFFGVQGEEAWHYGIAVDQKFTSDLYAGAEFFIRDLETVDF